MTNWGRGLNAPLTSPFENHLRQCSSSSNSVYIVVAVGCLACATRTNREVYVQTLFTSREKNHGSGAVIRTPLVTGSSKTLGQDPIPLEGARTHSPERV